MKGSRFMNQKLGKRTSQKSRLLKARLETQRTAKFPHREDKARPPKGPSR